MQPLNRPSPATLKSVIPTTHNGGGMCAGFLDGDNYEIAGFETERYKTCGATLAIVLNAGCDRVIRYALRLIRITIVLGTGLCGLGYPLTSVSDPEAVADNRLYGFESQPLRPPRLSFSTIAQSEFDGVIKLENEIVSSEDIESPKTESRQFTISALIINRQDIFGSDVSDADVTRRVYRVIDALHVTTREKTILREIDLEPGSLLFSSEVEELERNLRAMGLFASVAVKLVPIDDKQAELHINTRDRLSVVFGASGSFLGGIGELGFTVGERNVNGSGDRLLLSYSGTTDGQLRGAIAYDDIHFIDHRHSAAYSVGRTEEGRFYHFKFARPFKTRVSNLSWSVKAESIGSDIDYYENGVSVAQVPQQSESLILEAYRRVVLNSSATESIYSRYFRYGSVIRFDRKSYEPTRGQQPDLVEAPLDNTRVFAGALLALSRNTRFEKTRGIDSVRFTEDLSFGYSAELLAGFDSTNNSEDVSETDPAVFLEAQYAFGSAIALKPGEPSMKSRRPSLLPAQTFGKVSFDGFSNLQSGDAQSWSAGVTLKLFNRSIRSHTLATRFSYVTSERGNDLPTQYTLGENNGLRGYAARQFSGSSRFRMNLEDRINTGWRVGVFDVGLLAFVDAGWTGDDTSELSLNTAAGVGLRLGSNALLGADVVRLDLAYPFNPVDGESRLSVSLSLGQVFSF